MKAIAVGIQALASLKEKASPLSSKFNREKKAKREDSIPEGEPVTETALTLQPIDIPRAVHAKKSKHTSLPAASAVAGPTLQSLVIPRPVHAKKPQKPQTATVPENVVVPILQPMDIPRPVHAKSKSTQAQQTTEATVPENVVVPILQPMDIPRPVHAKSKSTQAQQTTEATVPENVVVPILQPMDIPRPVHAKSKSTQPKETGVVAPTVAPAPTPTLQPFDIPRPLHSKKRNGISPTKKDAVPAAAQAQTQNLAATPISYPPRTNHVLFPPVHSWGPPTIQNRVIWALRQFLSHILSGIGVMSIIIAFFIAAGKNRIAQLSSGHLHAPRPCQEEEDRRAENRKIDEEAWMKRDVEATANLGEKDGFVPTEGGPDKFIVDVGYYARRVGLDCEDVQVQTEDGFVLNLWHVYDPREYTPLTAAQRTIRGPESIDSIRAPSRAVTESDKGKEGERKQKYPILMLHGLLQSAGVYATNDDHSLAFWLCKQGYDVWLGNSRCGFKAEHVDFKASDPRMWEWNITHMATLDLPALTARVLSETSCPKLGLVAHSQGTTQTLVALSKNQRPSISSKISVFCGLAPAAYAGPLLNERMHFKFMRIIPVSFFRLILGIKAFLPMISVVFTIQGKIPQRWVGGPAYHVYNFLFGWGDSRWDQGVRDRCFMFAPTLISVEAMKWWLSRDGFAGHGSILSEKNRLQRDVEEDLLQDYFRGGVGCIEEDFATELLEKHVKEPWANESWFDECKDGEGLENRTPPMAFWIAGDDTLCDGRELLNRFDRGREPGVRLLEGGSNVIEGYSHLDVVWACDVIEKVGWGIRDSVWSTIGDEGRERFRVPFGVEGVRPWVDDRVNGVKSSDQSTDLDSESEKEHEAGGERKVLSG